MTIRVMPPADGLHPSITVFGRAYTCALGSTLDVPPGDAQVMTANGWTSSSDAVGATAARPANPALRQRFHDTTLGYDIIFDGKVWRNPTSGAAV
jgi:hypothetical protein